MTRTCETRIEPSYRSTTYDGRAVTGLDGAEIGETETGHTRFYRTPRGTDSLIPQTRTPRRVRMRSGVVEHTSNRWHGPQYFRVVERMRAESFGSARTQYGWRAVEAVEVLGA